jgi:hypothetical protein
VFPHRLEALRALSAKIFEPGIRRFASGEVVYTI